MHPLATLNSRMLASALCGFACSLACLLLAPSAHATYPGENGRLLFVVGCGALQAGAQRNDCTTTRVRKFRAIDPRTGNRLRFRSGGCRSGCDPSSPRFSPGGRKLAFNRVAGGERARPFVSDAAGGRQRQVRSRGETPTWSPGGRLLAMGGAGGIRIVRPNGRVVRRLTALPAYELDWSSRGQIAFVRGAQGDLYTISGRGGTPRRITRCGCVAEASWSPDGRRLALFQLTQGPFRVGVFVINRDGSGSRQIARGATSPVWSPDGRSIAYSRGGGDRGDARVVIARADGRARRVVYRIRVAVLPSISDLAWQPRPRPGS